MGQVISFADCKKNLLERRRANAFSFASHEVFFNNSARIGIANLLIFAKACDAGQQSIIGTLEHLLGVYDPKLTP